MDGCDQIQSYKLCSAKTGESVEEVFQEACRVGAAYHVSVSGVVRVRMFEGVCEMLMRAGRSGLCDSHPQRGLGSVQNMFERRMSGTGTIIHRRKRMGMSSKHNQRALRSCTPPPFS